MHENSNPQETYRHENRPTEGGLHVNRNIQETYLHGNGPTYGTYPQENRPTEDILRKKMHRKYST